MVGRLDQPKLHVRITQSFNISAHYYGWAGSQSSYWKSCDIQGQTFHKHYMKLSHGHAAEELVILQMVFLIIVQKQLI